MPSENIEIAAEDIIKELLEMLSQRDQEVAALRAVVKKHLTPREMEGPHE